MLIIFSWFQFVTPWANIGDIYIALLTTTKPSCLPFFPCYRRSQGLETHWCRWQLVTFPINGGKLTNNGCVTVTSSEFDNFRFFVLAVILFLCVREVSTLENVPSKIWGVESRNHRPPLWICKTLVGCSQVTDPGTSGNIKQQRGWVLTQIRRLVQRYWVRRRPVRIILLFTENVK